MPRRPFRFGHRAYKHSLTLLLGLGLLLPPLAEADRYPSFNNPIDFSLSLSNSDLELHTQNLPYPISMDRISVSIYSNEDPRVQFGFITGSSYLSIDNDPVATGINLNGYHAGLAMRSELGNNPQIGLHAQYLYQETKNDAATQSINLIWHEWAAGVTGTILLGQQLELMAGWTHHEIEARRRATGSITNSQTMKLKAGDQGVLAMGWRVSAGGRIGVSIEEGSYRRVEFNFARSFR